jgi:hypothetical protein
VAADAAVRNVSIQWEDETAAAGRRGDTAASDDGDRQLSYAELCALVIAADGTAAGCWANEILDLGGQVPDLESGNISLTFPIWLNPDTFKVYPLPLFMGGFELDEFGSVGRQEILGKYIKINNLKNILLRHKFRVKFRYFCTLFLNWLFKLYCNRVQLIFCSPCLEQKKLK